MSQVRLCCVWLSHLLAKTSQGSIVCSCSRLLEVVFYASGKVRPHCIVQLAWFWRSNKCSHSWSVVKRHRYGNIEQCLRHVLQTSARCNQLQSSRGHAFETVTTSRLDCIHKRQFATARGQFWVGNYLGNWDHFKNIISNWYEVHELEDRMYIKW